MSQHDLTPYRMVVRAVEDGDVVMCCPFCGSDCVHPAEVAVDQGMNRTTVSYEATRVETSAANAAKSQRGSEISLAFWGECGHRFRYRLTFRGGRMSCELFRLPAGNIGSGDKMWLN